MDCVVYSDESYVTAHRYRSIAAFSFPVRHGEEIVDRLSNDLSSSDVSEFKWKKLDGAKYRHCALKLIDSIIHIVQNLNARVDTIIWDTRDTRHTIKNRDDNANFERMFFHLHRTSFRRREKKAKWRIHPDERMGVDWQTIRSCLSAVGQRKEFVRSPLFGDFFTDPHYSITGFEELDSENSPCIQMADFFAGMAVFSRVKHETFWKWHAQQTPSLFAEEKLNLSRSDIERFPVLNYLNCLCKRHSLGISLKGQGGLYTYDSKNPLNFWLYKPQHEADQAPVKVGGMNI